MATLLPFVISSGRILQLKRYRGLVGGKTTPLFSPENKRFRCFSKTTSSLEPPDLPRLAETARISLTQTEVEEFAPKIQQVVEWFGQLQNVDLQSIEPAIRADSEGSNWRDDVPKTFENREAIVAAVPNYEDSFIKVPKILNKE